MTIEQRLGALEGSTPDASRLVASGVDPATAHDHLGHSSLAIIDRYVTAA